MSRGLRDFFIGQRRLTQDHLAALSDWPICQSLDQARGRFDSSDELVVWYWKYFLLVTRSLIFDQLV